MELITKIRLSNRLFEGRSVHHTKVIHSTGENVIQNFPNPEGVFIQAHADNHDCCITNCYTSCTQNRLKNLP